MNRSWMLFVLLALSACAVKADSGIKAELFLAPDGSQCYAIVQNGTAVGGNCR